MSLDPDKTELPVGDSPAVNVPVFSCHVYVVHNAGAVRARVANLAGIEKTAADERTALLHVVAEFKQRMEALLQAGEPIPWLEPIARREPDELERLIAVHL